MERGSPGHYLLGLKILNMLVLEMNLPTPGRTLSAVSVCLFWGGCGLGFRGHPVWSVHKLLGGALTSLLSSFLPPLAPSDCVSCCRNSHNRL